MVKLIHDYFKPGFKIANLSLEFAVISIFLALFSYIPILFAGTIVEMFLNIINIVVLLFSFGFNLSIPLFLMDKQKQKVTNWNLVFDTSLKNTKRLIIPGILIVGIIFVITFITLLVTAMAFRGSSIQVTQIMDHLLRNLSHWNPISVFILILTTFLSYTAFFFVLESRGLFRSMKDSVIYGFKHFRFTIILMAIGVVVYTVFSFVPLISTNIVMRILQTVIYSYLGLFVLASTLLYYEKHKH